MDSKGVTEQPTSFERPETGVDPAESRGALVRASTPSTTHSTPPHTPGGGTALPAQARTTLLDHLDRGGGLLCMHSASICFDDWQGWPRVLGGSWTWPKSHHPPLGWTGVRVHGTHPVVEGLRDFDVVDEVYSDLDVLPDVEPLASANGQPLVWARPVRRGRVFYDALGHDTRSYDNEIHRTMLQRAAMWLLKRPVTIMD